ncbi:MAG: DUF4249 domain-containing protein [bacterium]
MKRLCFVLIVLATLQSCIEEIATPQDSFTNSILVVEATLTDQLKFQEVRLSKTYPIGEEQTPQVSGANVSIVNSTNQTINFTELEPGLYISDIPFAASVNTDYQLKLTVDNKSYSSSLERLAAQIPINNVTAQASINDLNEEGVSIVVNTVDPGVDDIYLRYEYEETYKIIAPRYSPQELTVLNNDFPYPQSFLNNFINNDFTFDDEALRDFFFDLSLREEQKQICFNTVNSNKIFQTSSDELTTNDISFELRFLDNLNPIIRHRYSILVRQLVQTRRAFEFYELLNSFSSNDDVFSQLQVGFIEGNITNETNEQERIVGFFEVASVDEQRIFFDYNDIYPDAQLPPYFISCDFTLSPEILEEDFAHNITNSPIIDALGVGFIFYEETEFPGSGPFSYRPYQLVFSECGDCTNYGETLVPSFWEE